MGECDALLFYASYMARTVIAQLSDPHIPGPGEPSHPGLDPARNFAMAMQHAAMRCSHIVITGDCAAQAGTDAEYQGFADAIANPPVPLLLAAGNHDESSKMQRLYSLPSQNGRLDYAHDVPGGRIVVMDSSRLGREDGALDAEQCDWLDEILSDGVPILVAMHHPCIAIGGRALDGVRLDDESIGRLSAVIAEHSNVLAVVSGHAHMTFSAPFAGTIAYICPSTACEFNFRNGKIIYRDGPPQYMEYSWGDGGAGFLARTVSVTPESQWQEIPGQ